MIDGDDVFEPITGRDPVAKTMVESFVASYPSESNEQIAERIRRAGRSMGGDLGDVMTAEIVARWRPEMAS
ncbi:hypothetical protein ACIA5D_36645 [Actinoplanes sp. NPDC051513]|uniref:hypothetical protein n=1 Tax=Actinoplanes sp. NPDC051513 TaxID=3363908 RepID=UPI0037AA22C5